MKLAPNDKVKAVLQTFATDGKVSAVVQSVNDQGIIVNVDNTVTVAIDTSEKATFAEGTNLVINTETLEYVASAGLSTAKPAKPAKPSRPAGQGAAVRETRLND